MIPDLPQLRLFALSLLFAALVPVATAGSLHADQTASFTVDARLGDGAPDRLQVRLDCQPASDIGSSAAQFRRLPRDGTAVFEVSVPPQGNVTCAISAEAPQGLEVRYLGDGGSPADIGDAGCLFTGVQAGHANFCQIQATSPITSVTVYKRWIGATRYEPDVRADLVCAGAPVGEGRDINAGKPGVWVLDVADPEGVTCDVLETGREEFIADPDDCRGLLVLPGSEEECTMVNTKVVKMIEMLNRYGLVVMILVFMAVGMVAARRFVS